MARIRFRNVCGSCSCHGWYLDIIGATGELIMNKDGNADGARWLRTKLGGGIVTIQNRSNTEFKGHYLGVQDAELVLVPNDTGDATRWRELRHGSLREYQNLGSGRFLDVVSGSCADGYGKAIAADEPATGTKWDT